jgi:hypothetical protein
MAGGFQGIIVISRPGNTLRSRVPQHLTKMIKFGDICPYKINSNRASLHLQGYALKRFNVIEEQTKEI